MNDGDSVGWKFRATSNSYADGYLFSVDRSGSNYFATLKSLATNQIQERVKLWFAPHGTLRFSVQENDFGVWVEGVLVHVFHNGDFTGDYLALSCSKDVSATVSQLDDLISDIIVGTQGNAFSAINEVISDRVIYFADDQNGDLEFYRTRDDEGVLPDIVFSMQSEKSDTVVTRARIEGIQVGEVWDFEGLKAQRSSLHIISLPADIALILLILF